MSVKKFFVLTCVCGMFAHTRSAHAMEFLPTTAPVLLATAGAVLVGAWYLVKCCAQKPKRHDVCGYAGLPREEEHQFFHEIKTDTLPFSFAIIDTDKTPIISCTIDKTGKISVISTDGARAVLDSGTRITELSGEHELNTTDQNLILATNGVWKALREEAAVGIVRLGLFQTDTARTQNAFRVAATQLITQADAKTSSAEPVSAIVINLHEVRERLKRA